MSIEIADLQEVAARFAALAEPGAAESPRAFDDLVAAEGLHDRVEQLADALTAGAPGAFLEMVAELAAEIEQHAPLDPPRIQAQIYRAATGVRLRRPDLGEVVGALEQAESGGEDLADDPQTDPLLQSLASALAPLAGLDLAATLHYAGVFIDNFPSFSLPLGDVDERATRWLAQLLDMGTIRPTLRRTLLDLADAWEEGHPRAASRLRSWSDAPPPSDPTQDQPWMQALLPLVRTQV